MKAIVKKQFYDKTNLQKLFLPGEVVDWDDQERIEICMQKGLIEPIEKPEPEKAKKKTKSKK